MKITMNGIILVLMIAALATALASPPAVAQEDLETAATTDTGDPAGTGEETEAPEFSNPAQAAKAEALAEAVAEAAADTVEATEAAVAEAREAVTAAQATLDQAATPEEEAAAQAALEAASANLEAAEAAAAAATAEAASVDMGDVASMREAGLGWGEIARELGVHPSTVGLGHKNRNRDRAETRSKGVGREKSAVASAGGKATGRDMKSGISSTPGARGGKGRALGLDKTSKSAKSGSKESKSGNSNSGGNSNAGGNGKGRGRGNSGGNGNGHGGGNGGGNGKG